MKTTIAWCSDSHLDYTQYGNPIRRQDFAIGLSSAVDDMIAARVNAIIHTGDLFNSSRPSAESIRVLQDIHARLIVNSIFMYVISGNHDWSEPPWIAVLTPSAVGGIVLIDDLDYVQVGDVKIKGYASMGKEALLQKFATDNLEGIDVLMLHQMVKEFTGYPSPSAISIDEIPDKFQLVAVGDLHILDIRNRNSGGLIGYTGSTEMCSSSESPDKRWNLLTFDGNRLLHGVAKPVRSRPVIQWDIQTEGELEAALNSFDAEEKKWLLTDARTPMLFVRYPTTMPGVLDRIMQKLDPENYIIVPQPQFVSAGTNALPISSDDGIELNVLDVLQLELPQSEKLFKVASQLFNPDADAKAALNTFVEEQLAVAENDTQST